jgi:flagellar motor switch protein FliG
MALLEKLVSMTNDEIQGWLRTVDPTTLGIALLGENATVRSCVVRNMSARAGAVLTSEMQEYERMDPKELVVHMSGSALRASL